MIGVTGGSSLLRWVPPAHAATAAASANANASDTCLMRRLYRPDARLTYTARTARIAMALDPDRILARCDALAAHSEQPDGLTRVFLSPQQRAVNDLVLAWMREAGMDARLDAIGNCVGRYEGTRPAQPCLMLGSHLDTVRDAGRYDGMLGVVTAIECVDALARAGRRLDFAIEVVGFGDEEGVRFGSTLLGSRAVAGAFDAALLDKRGSDGVSLHDAMRAFGLDPARIGEAAHRAGHVIAYVELHIEQGPVLESIGLPVGVVTAINGGYRFGIEIQGVAGHAGTVPMALRRDALAAAAECIAAVERIAGSMPDVVGTVGRIEAHPGAMNVIPGRVRFSLDLRAPTDARRSDALDCIRAEFDAIAARRRVALELTAIWEARTAPCDPRLQARIAAAIEAEGHGVHRLPSGAGHDGMALIDIAPIGMLFVRCKDGVSHNPAESVTRDDVAAGARVLARFIETFTPLEPA
jgi:allantoate deiminase